MDVDCDDPIVREIPVILNNDDQTNFTCIDIDSKDISNLSNDHLQVRFQYEPHDQKLELFWSKDTIQKYFSKQKYHKYETELKNILRSKTDIKPEITAEKILRETKYVGENFPNTKYDLLTGKFDNDRLVLFPVRKHFLMKTKNNYANQLSAKLRNAKTINSSKSKSSDNLSSNTNSETNNEQNTFEEITIRFSMTGINAKKAASRKPHSFIPVDWHDFDSNMALTTFKKMNGAIEKTKTQPELASLNQCTLTIKQKLPPETSQTKCANGKKSVSSTSTQPSKHIDQNKIIEVRQQMAKKRVDISKTNDRLTTNQIDLDEDEPNFDDPEGFVDDISDEEIARLTNLTKPTTNHSMDNVVIVDGIPKVKPELFKKLHTVLTKLFSKFGDVTFEKYYRDENGYTTGMVFLEYETSDIANEAIRVLNNHKMDKTHTLLVNSYCDIDKYTDENLKELEVPERKTFNKNIDLYTHMLDPDAFDQYALLFADRTVEVWKNSSPDPELLDKRAEWTISYIKWSPMGAFLATLHTKGLLLWAGDKFEKFDRYPHERVELLDFSPSERFLVTYSPVTDPANNNQRVVIWDVVTSAKRRLFDIDTEMINWPMFRWSHKDQYFARIVKDALYIYETKTFSLLDKKPISGIVGLRDFAWSPTDNYIAYWVAELKDVPARVVVVEIPSRTEIAYKNMCNVVDCKIHWQKNGDYLCVKVDRFARTKKEKNETKYVGMSYNFEIFHMRSKLIPVDSIVIKETIQDFAIEPTGSKVAIIHGEGQNASVSFYQLKSGSEPSLAKRIDKRGSNHISWSPRGQFVVVANLSTGTMDFIDTEEYQIMNTREHYQMSQIEWDPTGRYLTSSVSVWKVKTDHGFCIWSLQGRLLRQVNLSDFAQFIWRPHPPSLLSKEKEAEILKNLKKYYSKFESKDRMRTSKASKEIEQKQSEFKQKWQSYATIRAKEVNTIKRKRMEMREGLNTGGRYWDYCDKNTISDTPTEIVYKEDETDWSQ